MARTRITWNVRAFEEIRRLPKVDELLEKIVDDIVAEVGPGYEKAVRAGRTRSRGSVVTATAQAIIDNRTDNPLLRALARQRVGI